MKKILFFFLVLFLTTGAFAEPVYWEMTAAGIKKGILVRKAEVKDPTEWTLTGFNASATELTITKAALSGHTWMLTDISGGGTENGYLIIKINNVEVWRLRFPANGSTGQKVNLAAGTNQKIEAVISMGVSGSCFVNMRGVDVQ